MPETKIYEQEYLAPFKEKDDNGKSKTEAALERAWKNRDFEIDKYWSRATYFWAFIAVTFAGYISVKSTDKLDAIFKNRFSFIVICLGIIFSLAWLLVNIGSKKWQENWEKHIDMLEDDVTGPLYKTVLAKHSFSVSRVNIIVSVFVLLVWICLAIWHSVDGIQNCKQCSLDYIMTASAILTLLFVCLLLYTSKSGNKSYFFKRRTTNYVMPEHPEIIAKENNAEEK